MRFVSTNRSTRCKTDCAELQLRTASPFRDPLVPGGCSDLKLLQPLHGINSQLELIREFSSPRQLAKLRPLLDVADVCLEVRSLCFGY